MYSLSPLVDQVNHGAWVFLMIVALVADVAIVLIMSIGVTDEVGDVFLNAGILLYAVFCCIMTPIEFKPPKVYTNTPVEARFIEWLPEANKSGKSTDHRIYARLAVPGGETILEVSEGYMMPPVVTLYKN